MQKRSSKLGIGSNDSTKSEMENTHRNLLIGGASNENTESRSFIIVCKERTLKLTESLKAVSEVVTRGWILKQHIYVLFSFSSIQ